METKSRYEIMSDLEEKKTKLINAQASMGLVEAQLNRDIELAKEKLQEFLIGKDINTENIKDQLESIEKSLSRIHSQKK